MNPVMMKESRKLVIGCSTKMLQTRNTQTFLLFFRQSMRKVHIHSFMYSFSQAVIYFAYAGCFMFGAYLIEKNKLNYVDMFKQVSFFPWCPVTLTFFPWCPVAICMEENQKTALSNRPALRTLRMDVFTSEYLICSTRFCWVVPFHESTIYTMYFRVFAAIAFGSKGIGETSSFAPDFGKAKSSAVRIFKLLDTEPSIDSNCEKGDTPVSVCRKELIEFTVQEFTGL